MSTLDGLNGRAQRLQDAAPEPAPELYLIYPEEFAPLDKLTSDERAALEAFVARVQPKLDRGLMGPGPAGSRGYPDMRGLSNEDLLEWHLWCKRGDALERDDLAAAAKWRRYLTEGLDELIEQFLSIDEMSIPQTDTASTQHVKAPIVKLDYGGTKELHRTYYRYDRGYIERHRDRLGCDDIDTMHQWLDAFGGG